MRMTRLLINTLRDNPAEAEVVSHQLLVRAGYIRRVASGIYNYLPLMWRVIRKVEEIVRQEMDASGAQELLMPILQPAELWIESGRWDVYGKELVRLKDRHERDCVLGPTHEEVITTIARNEIHSYRQLPMNLYQIQNKYRDEVRPRFGLLRGREFIMKDAYSFHSSQEDLEREYAVMTNAYTKIFDRCGLETRMVQSDSGAIGGSVSHEFMVLTRIAEGEQESGENEVYYCNQCDYAANSEKAESILPFATTDGLELFDSYAPNDIVETPNTDTIEKLTALLQCPASLICKSLLYIKDEEQPFLVLIRGDLEVEETKLANNVHAREIRMATSEEIKRYFDSEKGFVGIGAISDEPLLTCVYEEDEMYIPGVFYNFRIKVDDQWDGIPILVDQSIENLKNFVIAYNKPGFHKVNFNWPESMLVTTAGSQIQRFEFPKSSIFNLHKVRVGDTCLACKNGQLEMTRGIEVGNIFQLGTKYSKMMSATYADEDGTDKHFIMGCYGIGVSRTAAAAIERFHDQYGIIWPMAIAPYQVLVVPVNVQDEIQWNLAHRIYETLLAAGVEVVIDDRDERAGVKFKDADLVGFPIRITAGKKAAEGLLEVKMRDAKDPADMKPEDILPFVQKQIAEWHPNLDATNQPVSVK